ncbi:hypothetical protein HG531_000963 [Fusarium graminearum]|nr:hypothetical protein HG531_000963 [Fusarium graminearum]
MTFIALPNTNFVITRDCPLSAGELLSSVTINGLQPYLVGMLSSSAVARSTTALFEAAEDVGVELEDIVEGDADEDGDYDSDGAALGVDSSHLWG